MRYEFLFLSAALLFTAGGQILYKLYFRLQSKIYLVAAIGSFCLVPLLNYYALKGLSIDVVYTATALTFVMVLLSGVKFLGERLSNNQIYGSILITLGTIIYNWN